MRIVNSPQIWDLHIHTNKCPKGSSEFIKQYKDNTKAFIDKFLEVINTNTDNEVSMISFTDHNHISLEVYNEFNSRNTKTVALAGVEIDYLSDLSDTAKHMIVYFDVDTKNSEIFPEFCSRLNQLLDLTRNKNEFMKVGDLLTELVRLNYNFLISPHAFKQGPRGVQTDWNEDSVTHKNKHLYTDQFFCFWEAGGLSDIEQGKEFLKFFEMEGVISLISFSDSNNFEKLSNYIKNPPQYFNSLPSFRGLALIGTESSRITTDCKTINTSDYSNIMKTLIFDKQRIELSPRLNAIIGGRGSGKSLLLDKIAHQLGTKNALKTDRIDFINRFDLEILDWNDTPLTNDFHFDYFEQSYVSDIFNSTNRSFELEKRFEDSFRKIESIDLQSIKQKNLDDFKEKLSILEHSSVENIKSIETNFRILKSKFDLSIRRSDKDSITKNVDVIEYKKYEKLIENISKNVPKQINENPTIKNSINALAKDILTETNKYNKHLLETSKAKNLFIDTYLNFKSASTQASKDKNELVNSLETRFNECSTPYRKRVEIISAVFEMQSKFKSKIVNSIEENGSIASRFAFTKELKVESPVEFLYRCFGNHYHKTRLSKFTKFDEGSLSKMIELFIIGEEGIYKDDSSCDTLYSSISDFTLEYTSTSNIYYQDNGLFKNIEKLSPGARTNILMEYIVYRDTKKPLLIDQPEDNIDNMTIYNQLKKWFSELKFNRQVIVVTHDANIVINSDSENIIVANQVDDEKFVYSFGAMEYEDNLEKASIILDGGYEAIERRIKKYDTR